MKSDSVIFDRSGKVRHVYYLVHISTTITWPLDIRGVFLSIWGQYDGLRQTRMLRRDRAPPCRAGQRVIGAAELVCLVLRLRCWLPLYFGLLPSSGFVGACAERSFFLVRFPLSAILYGKNGDDDIDDDSIVAIVDRAVKACQCPPSGTLGWGGKVRPRRYYCAKKLVWLFRVVSCCWVGSKA